VIHEVRDFVERRFAVKRLQRKLAVFSRFEFDDGLVRMNRGNDATQIFTRNRDLVAGLELGVCFFRRHGSMIAPR